MGAHLLIRIVLYSPVLDGLFSPGGAGWPNRPTPCAEAAHKVIFESFLLGYPFLTQRSSETKTDPGKIWEPIYIQLFKTASMGQNSIINHIVPRIELESSYAIRGVLWLMTSPKQGKIQFCALAFFGSWYTGSETRLQKFQSHKKVTIDRVGMCNFANQKSAIFECSPIAYSRCNMVREWRFIPLWRQPFGTNRKKCH